MQVGTVGIGGPWSVNITIMQWHDWQKKDGRGEYAFPTYIYEYVAESLENDTECGMFSNVRYLP